MWPLNISVGPPPAPGQRADDVRAALLDLLPLHLEAHPGNVSAISRAIASSSPVKLGVETAASAHSTSRSRLTWTSIGARY